MSDNLYAERDVLALREHYCRHVDAMTREGLHDKSDIAAELAWRDSEIERLTQLVERAGEPVAWINPQVLDAITRHGFLDRVNHRVRLRSSPKASENSVPLYALNTAPGASHER